MAEKPTHEEINQKKMLPKASSAQWQTTFDAIRDAVCLLNMNGKFLRCNKAMEGLLKKSSEEIIGGTCWELIHGTDKPIKGCPVVRMKKTLCRESLVLKVDDKWLNVTVDPVIDETGNLTSAVHIISDITRRKQAEQSLQEAEAELKHIIEVVPGIIAKVNAHTGYFTYCNPALSSILGFSSKEFLARPFIEFVHIDDRQSTLNEVEKQLKGSPLAMFENRYICKNGSYKWLEWRATSADEKGVVYAAATDITERKQAEDALRESKENLRAILDASPDVIHLLDINGIILSTNDGFAKRVGLEIDDVMGKCIFDYVPTESLHNRKAAVEKVFRTGEPLQLEDRGLTGIFESHIHPVFNPVGEVTAVAVYARDITERKKAEETLQRSESLLNATQQLSKVGGWEWDVEKQTMFWSDEVYRIHDFQPSEFTPGSMEHIEQGIECYDPEDRPVIMEAFRNCAEKGKAYDIEFPFTTALGRRIWIRTVANPVLKDEKVVKITGNIIDITERKQAEKELQKRMNELETFYRATINREERVIELKQEVNELLEQLGKNKKYRDYSK